MMKNRKRKRPHGQQFLPEEDSSPYIYNEFKIDNSSSFIKKLKRGKINPEKIIDLHGYNLLEAEKKFDEEVANSFNTSTRCILFITGKGARNKGADELANKLFYGKIRSNINNWAKKDQNQKKILHISKAHVSHGGDGSFYIYLRKKRSN